MIEREGDYEACRFKLGIGAETGSAVIVREVSVS